MSAKGLLPIGCAVVLALACVTVAKYSSKYDNVDIDAIIANNRLLNNYVGCLLDNNPCTPDAAELKEDLPDALANNCSSCTEAQKRIMEKLSQHLIDHRPHEWSLLEDKYDPSGTYREIYLHPRRAEDAAKVKVESAAGNGDSGAGERNGVEDKAKGG